MKKIITSMVLLITMFMPYQQANAQCGTPSMLTANYVAPNMVLSWSAIPGASRYAINIQNASGNNVFFNATFNSTTNSYSIAGLTLNANYKFKVRAHCSSGHGSWSPYAFFIAGNGGTGGGCGAVTGVMVTTTTASGGTFTWNPVQGATAYRVRIENGSGNPVAFANVATVSGTTYTKGGLQPGTNYKVKVRALCGGNLGAWSAWVPFTTATLRLDGTNTLDNAEMSLIVSPNPSTVEARIIYNGPAVEEQSVITVHDLMGRQLFTDKYFIDGEDYLLPVSNLSDGQYIITLINGPAIVNQRMMVKH
jgi:Fibronectin type III domain